jgi:hypothetical protein
MLTLAINQLNSEALLLPNAILTRKGSKEVKSISSPDLAKEKFTLLLTMSGVNPVYNFIKFQRICRRIKENKIIRCIFNERR